MVLDFADTKLSSTNIKRKNQERNPCVKIRMVFRKKSDYFNQMQKCF